MGSLQSLTQLVIWPQGQALCQYKSDWYLWTPALLHRAGDFPQDRFFKDKKNGQIFDLEQKSSARRQKRILFYLS
jgi:hypothetical protein